MAARVAGSIWGLRDPLRGSLCLVHYVLRSGIPLGPVFDAVFPFKLL